MLDRIARSRAMRRTGVLAAAMIALAAGRATGATTSVYTDGFEGYDLPTSMNGPSGSPWSPHWTASPSWTSFPDNGSWHVDADPIAAASNGNYATLYPTGTNPLPSGWMAFTADEENPIQSAQVTFDYCVQTVADLSIYVSEFDGSTGLIPVPFAFTHRANSGELEDTATIDLTPYLSGSSKRLVVVFQASSVNLSYSHVRIDDFRLTVNSSPPCVPGPLGLDAPQHLYDPVTHGNSSLVAGSTVYLVRGDFNGDGYPDVVNVTNRGAQVFLNEGTTGGNLSLHLAQEFAAPFSYGGGAVDADGDGDLDLVLGELDSVVVATNDGTGNFAVSRPVTHRFAQPTVAVPFRAWAGGPLRVAVCAASDNVAADALGPNPLLRPYLYVLESGVYGWSVVQQLDPVNCGGIAVGDFDQDGYRDLVASNRSYVVGPLPAYAYRHAGPAAYAPSALDTSGTGYSFGYRPFLRNDGDLALGTWHRTSIFTRGAMGWSPASNADLPAGFPTGETYCQALADMDCDGLDDLVFAGRNTPVVLQSLVGSPNDPAGRFTATDHDGTSEGMLVADFDRDTRGADDVIVGGSRGLFFLRNSNGGTAGTPAAPPRRPSYDALVEAFYGMWDLLDPHRMPEPMEDFGARADTSFAAERMAAMDPYFLKNDLPGSIPYPFPLLQDTYTKAHAADFFMYLARVASVGQPGVVGDINDVRFDLQDGMSALVDEAAAALSPIVPLPPNPAKAGKGRSAKSALKVFRLALADRDTSRQMAAMSRIETSASRQEYFHRRTIDYSRRAADRLARAASLLR